jgi:cell division GTPase FtsZ
LRPFIIGVGRAGCKIASVFLREAQGRVPYTGVLLDTDSLTLAALPHRHRLLLGERFLDGNGANFDLELGRQILDEEKYNIVELIDRVKDGFDCLLVVSAFGGGTGGGVDVLIEELKRSYMEPVYYLGVLPGEQDVERALVNFSESFKPIVAKSDAVFPVDNEALSEGLRVQGQLNAINEKIFRYFNNLFEVGEYRVPEELGSNVLGATDVINTLSGVSSIGVAGKEVRSSGFFGGGEEAIDKPELVVHLTKRASQATLVNFDLSAAKRALVVVSGPRRYLDFLGSIPARLWIEKQLSGEVRGGDLPANDKRSLEVTVLYSGIRRSDRIRYLYQLGRMLARRGEVGERFSRVYEKFKLLRRRIADFEALSDEIYEEMREIAERGRREEKEE